MAIFLFLLLISGLNLLLSYAIYELRAFSVVHKIFSVLKPFLIIFLQTYLCPHILAVGNRAAVQERMVATHTSDSQNTDGPGVVVKK